jgi:hypothetical protein
MIVVLVLPFGCVSVAVPWSWEEGAQSSPR